MATGSDIAKAYVQIIPSADGIQGKLTEVMGGEAEKAGKSSGSKFGKALGKGIAAGGAALASATGAMTKALISGTQEVAQYGDQIDKMSQKLGLSATAYQQWDYVLGQAGADINSMSVGMKTLTNKLDDAKNGSESAQQMFAALGLSMEDLAGMSREEVFENVIYGFQGMADSTERAALANDLFGKSGQELTPLFNQSVEDTQALIAASDELGFVMGDQAVKNAAHYHDSLDTLTRTFGGVKNSLMGEFMPSITAVMDGLTALISGGDGVEQLTIGLNAFVMHISDAMPRILDTGTEIILALVNAIVDNLPQLLDAGMNAIVMLGMGIIENLPAIIEAGLQVIISLAQGIAESLPEMIPTIIDVVMEIVDILTEPSTLSLLIEASIAIIIALANGLIDALPKLIEKAPEIVGNLVTAIVQNAPKLLRAAFELIKTIGAGIFQNLRLVYDKGKEIVQKVQSGIHDLASGLWSAGMDIVKGIWQGISNGFGWIKPRISGWVGDLLGFFKRILKIGSPSKVFADEVGKWMALGMGEGFVDEMGTVEDMMGDSIPTAFDLLGKPGFSATARGSNAYNYGGVTIQILGRGKDADQLAVELQNALVRRAAAWA